MKEYNLFWIQNEKKESPDFSAMCQNYIADESAYSEENIAKRNITDIVENNGDIEETLMQTKIILAKRLYK